MKNRKNVFAILCLCAFATSAFAVGPHATVVRQYRADSGAEIPFGTGTIPTGVGVYFAANVTSDENRTVRMDVELRQLPATFTAIPNYSSSLVSSGTRAQTLTATGMAAGNWGWKYRIVDSTGVSTGWQPAGNPDFIVQSTAQVPTVTTLPATPTSANSATLNGRVDSNGGATITDRRFEWAKNSGTWGTGTQGVDWGLIYNASISGPDSGFSALLNGLQASTTYKYRVYAWNSVGPSSASLVNVVTFTTGTSCSYSLSSYSASPSSSSGSSSFSVYVGSGCSWSAVSDSTSWLQASGSGPGNGTVSYSYSANTSTSPRTGHITVVSGQVFTVTQAGTCSYSLSSYSASPGSGASSGSFSVYAGSGCSWSASSDSTSWLQASGSGPGNGTVSYTYSTNPNATSRIGHITIQSQTFIVTQAGSSVVDYPGAAWMGPAATGNYESGRNGNSKNYIIVHTTEGSMASALSRFQTAGQQASSHYIIGTNGTVWQVVRDADTAYSCGNLTYNYQSIGIEQEGWADGNPDFSWQTAAQRTALENLINWLHTQYGIPLDRAHVIGHNQVPSPGSPYPPTTEWGGYNNHHDPGAWFNWRHLMTDLGDAPAFNTINVQSAASITTLPQSGTPIIVPASPGQKFVAYDYYNGYYLVFLSGYELAQTGLASSEYHWDGWIPAANVTIDNSLTQLEVTNAFPSRWIIHSSPLLSASVVGRTIDGKRYVATGNTAVADNYTWREFYIATTANVVATGWVVADGLTVIGGSDAQGPALSILPLGLTFSSSPRSVVDLLVAYTPAASAEAVGDANLLNEIAAAVKLSNEAYVKSHVNHRLRLLSIEPINYTEAVYVAGNPSTGIGTDIVRLANPSDGFLDSVHSRRNQVGADIVALIEASSATDPKGGISKTMHTNSPSFESDAFLVVRRSVMIGYFGLPHEIGHIMGCGHDHAQAVIDGPDGIGVYPYSYGYILPGNNYGTIMSYPAPAGATYIPYFSNPDVLYGGIPTGVREDQPQPANNALSMNNTAATVAAFRNTVFAANVITISNNSASQITVTSISPETPAAWLSVLPSGSFSINPHTFQNVTVQVDLATAPNGYSNIRLLIVTNNASANPIAGGIAVVVDKDTPLDTQGPALTIGSPLNNAIVTSASLPVSGTASDNSYGNNGISSVTVNGISASGGTASGTGTAYWNATIPLNAGVNAVMVIANDMLYNSTHQQINVTYNPPRPVFGSSSVSGGQLQTTLSGLSVGETVVLEVSTDLKTWTSVQTKVASGTTLIFTNTINPAMKAQYFRAVVQ